MTINTTPSLTQRECDALYAALDQGYFDVPRQVPLTELADDLDTTGVELSERLRTGTEALLQHHRGESRASAEEP
jgi:hypothetical protein